MNHKISFILKLLFVIAFLGGAAILSYWWTIPVASTDVAKRGPAIDTVLGTLKIEEYHRLRLRSERNGRVLENDIEIGDQVSRGQVLLEMDSTGIELEREEILNQMQALERTIALGSSLRFQLLSLEEDIRELKANVEAGRTPRRQLELRERDLQQLKDNIEIEAINNEKNLESFRITIEKLNEQIEKMTIRSPVNGTVVDVRAREGDFIGGGEVVFEIIDERRLVTAEISEQDFSKIRLGQNAVIRILGFGDRLYEGRVRQILPTADPLTQRYSVYLSVDISEDELVPGLTGEVSIIVGERDNSVIVPARAMIGDFVIKVVDNRVRLTPVQRGFQGLREVEILDGLEPGDRVIVEELTRFRDGELVRLRN